MPETKQQICSSIKNFKLPAYNEIPDVGLYLEQTAKYISDYLAPVQETPVTGSMISNYVKKGLIAKPIHKQYNREQIAQLIFIATAKTVISMDDLHIVMAIQRSTYPSEIAYNYFRREFEQVLAYVFERENALDSVEADAADEKIMLHNIIITVAHKVYLDKLVAALRAEKKTD
ncbi:MAG: DUF1836 domain-containing protein [Clostridia bacterium]|nr:DUF1836 domain-containing protein [Clostridia bacterium]